MRKLLLICRVTRVVFAGYMVNTAPTMYRLPINVSVQKDQKFKRGMFVYDCFPNYHRWDSSSACDNLFPWEPFASR